ncbi:S-formylglutathione hydrolase [Diutina catenulata]
MTFETTAEIAQFGGTLHKLTHESRETGTKMDVNVFVPGSATSAVPVLLYLSGLTCTPANASEKSFLQYFANKYGFAVIFPDTSPRGAGIEGEDESWDFGTGAGFYVDATEQPWAKNYRMYSYVHKELQEELKKHFSQLDFGNIAITGHSMGGYGALAGFLKNPGHYKSVSAFAPIANPSQCPWGEKCFGSYLGSDKKKWEEYDPTVLVASYSGDKPAILIHQGSKDGFYCNEPKQLKPENFKSAAEKAGFEVSLNVVDGYDHSYFFISSFVEDHAKHHAKYLGLSK